MATTMSPLDENGEMTLTGLRLLSNSLHWYSRTPAAQPPGVTPPLGSAADDRASSVMPVRRSPNWARRTLPPVLASTALPEITTLITPQLFVSPCVGHVANPVEGSGI